MASSQGLTQRKKNAFAEDPFDDEKPKSPNGRSSPEQRKDTRARDPNEVFDSDEEKEGKDGKLTLMEEIVLLGMKDDQGYLSFFNDNISYVLRGCILMELSLRNRIQISKEGRRRPLSDRLVDVVNETPTGEVLLDEALKLIKLEKQSVGNWIDLMSGETWNLMKIGYQLKQVRERIAKGLVDKGVLRTEKRNFVIFDMATHPVADSTVKEALIRRCIDTLLGRIANPDKRTIGMVCAAYAANVIENALVDLSHEQREACFQRVDEMLQEHSQWTDNSKRLGVTEVMAGVLNVYTKMDSII